MVGFCGGGLVVDGGWVCDGRLWLVVMLWVGWVWREREDREIEMKREKNKNEWIVFNFDAKIRVLMWSELWNDKLK